MTTITVSKDTLKKIIQISLVVIATISLIIVGIVFFKNIVKSEAVKEVTKVKTPKVPE